MIAKFAGTCRRCKGAVLPGDNISWSRKHRGVVYHITCPNGSTASSEETETESTESLTGTSEEIKRDEEYTHVEPQTVHGAYIREMNKGIESETVKPHTNGNGSLAAMLATAIQEYLPGSPVDDAAVRDIFKQETKSLSSDLIGLIAHEVSKLNTVTTVQVQNVTTGEVKDMGLQHKQFPLLVKILAAKDGMNVWITGPAGSGKTTAAHRAADALGLKFYFCGAQSNEYGLLGFRDASGSTVRTLFREAYENGGVFLFDEIDASAPSAVLAFNAALANGVCAFPDAVVTRHADFVCIAAANTFGLGATNEYVGRMKQDAAFIDRFVFLAWDIDESLETATCSDSTWCKYVQRVRAKAKSKGIKVIISPRASYFGAKLLSQGIDRSDVETLALRKGMDATQWESVQ